MPDLLPLFWPLVDQPAAVLPGHLIGAWPPGALQTLIELDFLRRAENASCVICPECFEHEEEIIALDGPGGRTRWMIPCPQVLRVEVPPALLEQWAIHMTAVLAHLARSLQLTGQPLEMIPDRLWRIGRLSWNGNLHDVLFVRQAGASGGDFQRVFSTCVRPFVLFAGEVPPSAWWQKEMLPCASVPQLANCHAGGFTIDREALLGLLAQLEETECPAAPMFQQRGDFWVLTFAEETTYLKDSVGLAYIARLLSEPQRDIPAVSLLAARAGIDPLISTGSAGEILDEAARGAYSARYQDLCEELENATRHHDEGRMEKLQEEMELLTAELARATGLGGRGRQKSDADKVRISVTMAVKRALEAIAQRHERLGRHLLSSLSSGQTFRYSPEFPQHWRL